MPAADTKFASILKDLGAAVAKVLANSGYHYNLTDIIYDRPGEDILGMALTSGTPKVHIGVTELEYIDICNTDLQINATIEIWIFLNRGEMLDSTLADRQDILNLGRNVVSGFYLYQADIKSGAATGGDSWVSEAGIRQTIARVEGSIIIKSEFVLSCLDTI